MQTLHSIHELAKLGPAYLAIGVFDGVHIGHRKVIQRAVLDSRQRKHDPAPVVVVVTFDPHPMRVLHPAKAPRLLTSKQHKLQLISALGVDYSLVIPFDTAFANLAPEAFIQSLVEACNPLKEICVGYDWSFGKGRKGNLNLLNQLGKQYQFTTVGLPVVQIDNEVVSSTAIRQRIEQGDFAGAEKFLGHKYTILGTVVPGMQLGHALGFPTANLAAHNEQFPPNGVYIVKAYRNNQPLPGIVNLGYRPTISQEAPQRLLELHLLDFNEELYGQDIEIEFCSYLREEKKFENLEALKAQITKDVALARAWHKCN